MIDLPLLSILTFLPLIGLPFIIVGKIIKTANLLLNLLIDSLLGNLSTNNKNLIAHSYNTKAEIFLENKVSVDSILSYYNKSADYYKSRLV